MINFLINNLSRRHKQAIVYFSDLLIIIFSLWLAYSLKFDQIFTISQNDLKIFFISLFLFSLILYFQGIYNDIFRYSVNSSIKRIGKASIIYALLFFTVLSAIQMYYFYFDPLPKEPLPRSLAFIQTPIVFLLINISRLIIYEILKSRNQIKLSKKKIVIYGSNDTAVQISSLILADPNYQLCYFIDEDKEKNNKSINNIKIISIKELESRYKIEDLNEIIIAGSDLSIENKKLIIQRLDKINLKVKFIENLNNHIEQFSLEHFQSLVLDQFISNEEYISLVNFEEFKDKIILISGAGGSIGSELCQQLLKYSPKHLILFDHSEFNLYQITEKIKTEIAINKLDIKFFSILGSIKDKIKLNNIFNEYKPNYVFHAAAYKHVPLVEENILESISNNIIGTKNLIDCALEYDVKRFVLVSTDKAVRPTNVMGATKRLAELYVQAINKKELISTIVRFGNVFGSSGSVVPLFYKQIVNGGPITLTHKDITRYLMSIPEAVNLILESALYAKGKEVFVLDMGKPILIYDLAKKMIKSLGLTERNENNPNGDIEIVVSGMRPGEKLHEELIIGENYKKIKNSRIIIAQEDNIAEDEINKIIFELKQSVNENDRNKAKKILSRTVEGFAIE